MTRCFADDNCLPKRNNSKSKIGESRQKEESSDSESYSGYRRKYDLFAFQNLPYSKTENRCYGGHFAKSFMARDCM